MIAHRLLQTLLNLRNSSLMSETLFTSRFMMVAIVLFRIYKTPLTPPSTQSHRPTFFSSHLLQRLYAFSSPSLKHDPHRPMQVLALGISRSGTDSLLQGLATLGYNVVGCSRLALRATCGYSGGVRELLVRC